MGNDEVRREPPNGGADAPASDPTEGKAKLDLDTVGNNIFSDVLAVFVEPEVVRRQEAGEWAEGMGIFRFQVLLPFEGDPEVRLNDEVGGTVEVKPASDKQWQKGDDVGFEDIASVTRYEPKPEDAEVPHITGLAHAGAWSLSFDFNYRHPHRHECLRLARQFLNTARRALDTGELGPFVDNAFSTAELLARAELLSAAPTIEDALKSRSHKGLAVPYNLWARLENTDPRFAKLLNRLSKLRGPWRYLDGQLSLDEAEAQEMLAVVEEMESHASRAVQGEVKEGEVASFNVIATRDIKAGTLVRAGDFTLKPPRRPKHD